MLNMTIQIQWSYTLSIMHIIHDHDFNAFVQINVLQKWQMRTYLWFTPTFTKGKNEKQQKHNIRIYKYKKQILLFRIHNINQKWNIKSFRFYFIRMLFSSANIFNIDNNQKRFLSSKSAY